MKEPCQFTIRLERPLEFVTWKRSNFLFQWQQRRSSLLIFQKDWLFYVNKVFMISFERTCLTNIPDLDGGLNEYAQEEADTGIVLHPVDICKQDPLHP